jgi:hypothetical protein
LVVEHGPAFLRGTDVIAAEVQISSRGHLPGAHTTTVILVGGAFPCDANAAWVSARTPFWAVGGFSVAVVRPLGGIQHAPLEIHVLTRSPPPLPAVE